MPGRWFKDSKLGAGIDSGRRYAGPVQFSPVARESAQGGLLSLAGVAARLDVNRRELYRIRKADLTFPSPVVEAFGYRRAVMFRAADIHNWIRSK
jgi:predicted DNA-binding transcriptional regulator AlpA